ncbi:NUDIX domain-containing protein [Clostridium chrysemydis]|uniref:NUDIX domain-containing protein n=1 Tax=Clostridium chrysemydis TaxID=2665504 RepID=UPI001883A204|nr:NUDIX hydrolase [Clostridium chrysemydis]
MKLEEKIIKETIKYEGNFLKFASVDVELPDGKVSNRDIIRHPGASAIIAFFDDDTILLVKQYRAAIKEVLLELPAGKLDLNEDPLQCAKRELEEETGMKSNDFTYLGTIATGAGFTDEVIHIYKATNLFEGTKSCDEDEFIDIYKYKLTEVKKMIREGKIIDSKTIAAFMYL